MQPTLRLLTCGSVDDGKSTLIGRLLYDTSLVHDDQLATLARDSARWGTTGGKLDFALLLDGLDAEREQGITIDVAWRFFRTEARRFIVADSPGHEQYTANMATGASNAELAVVLVDATKGVLTQTRRHSFIASLLGIRHVVLAVNKIDLVGFDQDRFEAICSAYRTAIANLGFTTVTAIPICARDGDNLVSVSRRTPWYAGPTLLNHLETIDVAGNDARPFRMPVQWVNRPDADFRGYAGTIASGAIQPGDTVGVAGSGQETRIARIVTYDGDLDQAIAGQAVTLVLADALDISRGDVIVAPDQSITDHPITIANRLDARILWLSEQPLVPGRVHLLKLGTASVSASVGVIQHRIDIESFEQVAADSLCRNDVARVGLSLATPLAAGAFRNGADLGGFILIDRMTNATVAAGMIDAASSADITWHHMAIDRHARAASMHQKPVVVWFTGLSGSGKTTIADLVEQRLHALGRHSFTLDGDNLRHGLNRDLGFSEPDRVENIRRAAEVAKLMLDAGLIVLASFISPYRADRAAARALFDQAEFIEVFIDTPIDECRRRDPKGLYRRADAGLIRNFTGIDAPYEAPEQPELRLETMTATAETLAEQVVAVLQASGAFA